MPKLIGIGLLLLGLTFVFQNCQKVNFSQMSSSNSTSDIICDPFNPSTSDACPAGGGLIGNIYYRPTNASWDVRSSVDIIQKGTKVKQALQLNQLNIPERAFSSGFPMPSGGLVQNDAGQDLIEWFAIDMVGYFRVEDPALVGSYQFGVASDDGVALKIDGQNVVVNDTIHATTWNCSTQMVNFAQGERHDVSLRYFQGPRYHITLQLMWRPWDKRNLPCTNAGDWQPVPASVIFHD